MKLSELPVISLCPRCKSTEYVIPLVEPWTAELICMRCTRALATEAAPVWWTWHPIATGLAVITTWEL